jgi:hypothetical protein
VEGTVRHHIAPGVAVLAVLAFTATACGGGSTGASAEPATSAAVPATSAESTPAAASSPAAPSSQVAAAPSASCALPNGRDLIVRYVVPGVTPAAQVLGEVDLATCVSTLDDLQQTSPTGAGYCTQAGWVDQNPGYNADATPAPPIPHVVEEVGAGC